MERFCRSTAQAEPPDAATAAEAAPPDTAAIFGGQVLRSIARVGHAPPEAAFFLPGHSGLSGLDLPMVSPPARAAWPHPLPYLATSVGLSYLLCGSGIPNPHGVLLP